MLTLADCGVCHRLIQSFWVLTDDFSVNKPGIYVNGGYTLFRVLYVMYTCVGIYATGSPHIGMCRLQQQAKEKL